MFAEFLAVLVLFQPEKPFNNFLVEVFPPSLEEVTRKRAYVSVKRKPHFRMDIRGFARFKKNSLTMCKMTFKKVWKKLLLFAAFMYLLIDQQFCFILSTIDNMYSGSESLFLTPFSATKYL